MRALDRLLTIYRKYGKPYLPSSMRGLFSHALEPLLTLRGKYDFWRVRPGVARVLGPQFRRNRRVIGIALTYACNLRCLNCDESSAQAPADAQMSVEQIQRFVDECVAADYHWDLMEIAGGEPTMHPEFPEIIRVLREYRNRYSPQTRIKVLTNGAGEKVQQIAAQIPSDIEVENSNKVGKRQIELKHSTFNLTPGEVAGYENVDYTNACEYTYRCGTGLGPTGYYHCPVAAGMDRIFEWNLGRQSLPSADDDMEDLAKAFCSMCGYFLKQQEYKKPLPKQYTSPVWQGLYDAYHTRQAERLVPVNAIASAPSLAKSGGEESDMRLG
jgi:Radical SAM superfamily/4Fe-4S single cluster domain